MTAHSSSQSSCQTSFEFRPRNDLRNWNLPLRHQHYQMEFHLLSSCWTRRHQKWCPRRFLESQSANLNLTCMSKGNHRVIWWLAGDSLISTEPGGTDGQQSLQKTEVEFINHSSWLISKFLANSFPDLIKPSLVFLPFNEVVESSISQLVILSVFPEAWILSSEDKFLIEICLEQSSILWHFSN